MHNSVTIVGRLITEPTRVLTQNQSLSICTLRVCIKEAFGQIASEDVDVKFFGEAVDRIIGKYKVGEQVLVNCRLRANKFEYNGEQRSKLEVIGAFIQSMNKQAQPHQQSYQQTEAPF